MALVDCLVVTIGLFIIVALVSLGAAIAQVRLLRAVGLRFHGLTRTVVGCVSSAPTAMVIALAPAWLVLQFGCDDKTVPGLPLGFIGAYVAAVTVYAFYIKAQLPELRRHGFFADRR